MTKFLAGLTTACGVRSWDHLVEPMALGVLATAATGGVLAGSGATYWAIWHGAAAACFLGVRWRRRRPGGQSPESPVCLSG